MARTSILPWLTLLAAVGALLAAFFWPASIEAEDGHGRGGSFQFPVTYAEVELGDASETVELVGDVVSARRSTLAFHRTGTLAKVHARLGDRVAVGQLLAELDDAVLMEEYAAAKAALKVVQEQASYAAREAKRAEEVGGGVVSESEADRLRSEANTSLARVQQQEAETRKLAADLERGRLRAPFAGIIAQRLLDEGAQAGPSAPVLDLVDPIRREIRLEVPAQLVGSLQIGSMVELSLDERPEFHLQAKLDALVPATGRGSRSFTAVVRLDEMFAEDGSDLTSVLLPGLFVRAQLTLSQLKDQLLVPVDSVLHGERGDVIVLADAVADADADVDAGAGADSDAGKKGPPDSSAFVARFVPVRIVVRGAEKVAVLAFEENAIQVGDRVLITGVQNVFPGAPLGLSLQATEQ